MAATYPTAESDPTVAAAVAAHSADTTDVHGIDDTADLILEGDARLTDERVPTDGSVTAQKVAASLKASGTATGTDEAIRRLGTGATHAAAGDDSRFPSTGEKNALAGTSGTPGSGNKYVTDGDSRLSDDRDPTAHTHPQSEVTGLVADLAGKQPLDSDLTAIAALATTAYGRSVLEAANAGALRTLAGLVVGTDVQAFDSDLASIAALSTTSFGRGLLALANADALRDLHTHDDRYYTEAEVAALLAVRLPSPGFTSGKYYGTTGALIGNGVRALNQVDLTPFWCRRAQAFDRIGFLQATAAGAGGVTRLGIYNDDGNGAPGALRNDFGTVATDGTGEKLITIAETLQPGLYWLAGVPQVGAVGQVPRLGPLGLFGFSQSITAMGVANGFYRQTSVTGALPNPCVPDGNNASIALQIGLRAA